ncbi:MAG: cupin domain-containing protein [Thermodesulfobacteriota bacterium]
MVRKHGAGGYELVLEGIEKKTLVYGEKTLMTEFRLRKNCSLPRHRHPHEQTGYLVSGRIRLRIGAEVFDMGPGDSWSIAGDMEHGAEVLEDAVAVEVFSPVREDYLPRGRDMAEGA